jgi:hypothetical protein
MQIQPVMVPQIQVDDNTSDGKAQSQLLIIRL